MMSPDELKKIANKLQTSQAVATREYVQHVFLSALYQMRGADILLFKGGTALRIVYGSPRFSEDLDFTGVTLNTQTIEHLLLEVYSRLQEWGMSVNITEAKETTGGYLAKIVCMVSGLSVNMKVEISGRQSGKKLAREITRITNDYIPPYDIIHPPREEIIAGKLAALMRRSKPRDWYDLYFLLKHNYLTKEQLKLLPEIKKKFASYRGDVKKEIGQFLPESHRMVLKDFREYLEREMARFT
ncbi:hypothetical protein A3I42_03305 [Candidatus Uhrbacteria bacterium RIFCSPLOWO2_02_FULL_49_11]|uniref:Nucleotidyl transferase AbiEii/AbiGii toxin family protein n=1 Tax=Candidatus Uhrbacteria bacterium RIFCSPLOWO2_02_FULL_49_11 TaxID=1802409 RepID=A0A1F7VDF0_9BACT|nr:MAG: hypothetical protein A3I42_03305 [Candidatus Uhrbacteria bacterium RIFCSPLOWO2_02_FULL_49_11]